MKEKTLKKRKIGGVGAWVFLGLAGLAAGFANGLLGAGGGILIVFALLRFLGAEVERRDIYANALCVMVPISLVSCIRYASDGRLSLSGFGAYALPALVGGLLGGILLGRLKASFLKKLFGALVIWSGVLLIIR